MKSSTASPLLWLIGLAIGALPFSSANAIIYHGPIVVDDNYIKMNGNIITGNYQGTMTSPAINVQSGSPVTIINSVVTGPGDLIYGQGVDLTVIHTSGISTNPNVAGQQKGMFIHIEGAVSLDIENNTAQGPRFGIYINSYVGNFNHTEPMRIINNVFSNIDARPSDGQGGYVTSGEWNGHGIQLNQVHNTPNVEIAWNQIINTPRMSQCSDIINIYESSGTATSHILIHDNYVQGAYPANPGDKYTGGGIITDGSPNDTAQNATAYIDVYNNQVVSSANYGLSIAAGHDNHFYSNRVISSGYLSDHTFIPMSYSNGINNYNNYNQPATTFYNNLTELNNPVGLIASQGSGPNGGASGIPRRSDYYLPGQSGNTNVSFQPANAQNPTNANEQQELALWQTKLKAKHKKIGV
ncbi:MAG: hypothetical protein V4501_01135 [Pseudomonadota bacterium]